jgi:hypothetical protein
MHVLATHEYLGALQSDDAPHCLHAPDMHTGVGALQHWPLQPFWPPAQQYPFEQFRPLAQGILPEHDWPDVRFGVQVVLPAQ